jgi:hypothetical protein
MHGAEASLKQQSLANVSSLLLQGKKVGPGQNSDTGASGIPHFELRRGAADTEQHVPRTSVKSVWS